MNYLPEELTDTKNKLSFFFQVKKQTLQVGSATFISLYTSGLFDGITQLQLCLSLREAATLKNARLGLLSSYLFCG
jgi:hypothetical protein